MSTFDDIRSRVRHEVTRLYRRASFSSFCKGDGANVEEFTTVATFKAGQAERVVRVEYSRRVGEDVYMGMRDYPQLADPLRGRADGPVIVDGTSWYEVDQLPPPGWRVINPFAAP
jgi:hypothetical protein